MFVDVWRSDERWKMGLSDGILIHLGRGLSFPGYRGFGGPLGVVIAGQRPFRIIGRRVIAFYKIILLD